MSELDALEARFAEREPGLQAFVPEAGRFARLRREQAELERRWPDPQRRPPLFGVLVGVKDIFHVDGLPTRAGSRLPPSALRGPEAPSVTALKAAGALILGKTVTAEFACFAPGPTRNPRHPEHTPGGSSSGSAAAVAAGLCAVALGTQTIGSILRPAAFCGVVGFKPSRTQVARTGMIPVAPSLDEVGFFTRNVAAARLVASLLCDRWHPYPPERKPRMAVPVGPYLSHVSREGMVHFRSVCDRLADAGYEILPVHAMADFEEVVARHFRIVAAEVARVHRRWFARYGDRYQPNTAELIQTGQQITDEDLARDLAGGARLGDELTRLMDRHRFDLWISPSAVGPAPKGLDTIGDPVMNLPWTQACMPAISLPAGRNEAGLPMGLQVAAVMGDDEDLLHWAEDLEQVLKA
ncbi:MAG TPA: amidase [Thermoanaerobaculia bacterium]|nr:amidase [Thermoanaerobaculia bacterium]